MVKIVINGKYNIKFMSFYGIIYSGPNLWDTVYNSMDYCPEITATFLEPHESERIWNVQLGFGRYGTSFWRDRSTFLRLLIGSIQLLAQVFPVTAQSVSIPDPKASKH